MREHEEPVEAPSAHRGVEGQLHARAVVRLIQCSQCSYPLQQPMTLPCGNSLCRRCLPRLYVRENITYPSNPGRAEGFVCPFRNCGLEHSVGDCSMDVTLNKLVDIMKNGIFAYTNSSPETALILDELHYDQILDGTPANTTPRSRLLHGGCLVATYTFADMGELDYNSEVTFTPVQEQAITVLEELDASILSHLKEAVKSELDCQVCYSLMLDPLTTCCGHTFCRRCVARVLDHSNLCPACRRVIPLPPGVQSEPTNKAINQFVGRLFPNLLQLRLAAAAQEDEGDGNINIPLFVCTLAYPEMPLFLFIFEPRYRLMIRRAIESGHRKFGMLLNNERARPQGALGQTHFMQYGTMLHIENVEMSPDGRSLIETKGASRFKVLETDVRDGYLVGKVQRVDDISLSEEEAMEARETAGPEPAVNDALGRLNHMSTQRLVQLGMNFFSRAQATSEPWVAQLIYSGSGPPPSDPALLSYWFASVLPISSEEKYQLLPTTSVRERLKITARWIQKLEAARFLENFFCSAPPAHITPTDLEPDVLEETVAIPSPTPHSPPLHTPAVAAGNSFIQTTPP